MRIMGIDFGSKRIGIAVSDETKTIAGNLEVLKRKDIKSDLGSLSKKIEELNVGEIVIGYPLSLSGGITKKTKETENFIKELESAVDIPVKRWDERLSTVQAEGILIESGMRRNKRKRVVDALSAQIILQSYLEFIKNLNE